MKFCEQELHTTPIKVLDFDNVRYKIFDKETDETVVEFSEYKNSQRYDITINAEVVSKLLSKKLGSILPRNLHSYVLNYNYYTGVFLIHFHSDHGKQHPMDAVYSLIETEESLSSKFNKFRYVEDCFKTEIHVSELFTIDGQISNAFKGFLAVFDIINVMMERLEIKDNDIYYIGRNINDGTCLYYFNEFSNVYIKERKGKK